MTGGGVNYVLAPNGSTIHPFDYPNSPSSGSIQDRNGNQISAFSAGNYTETLGGTALSVSGGAPNPTTYTYTAPGANGTGTPAATTVSYKTYPIQTNYGCTGNTEYGASGAINNSLVDKFTLADGSFYQFSYEQTYGSSTNYTGRLASVTLPTGGTITYQYPTFTDSHGVIHNGGISCTDGSTTAVTRQTPDGSWTYTRAPGTGAAYTTKTTDPQSNDTVIQFQGIYETERQAYQGSSTSGTLLLTTNTCFNGAAAPCSGTSVTLPITQVTVTTQFGTSGPQSQITRFFNSYGLPTEEDDYDYGTSAPGPLLRKTLIAYASLGNNILDRIASQTVLDGAGNTSAQTTYTYDETSPVVTSGTPQQASITGSRGNATTIKKLVQGTATFLSTTVSYYDTGNPQTVTDVNGAQTTYNYANPTLTCGNAFPTTVSEPLSLSKSITWTCIGAVATQTTDENSQSTTTSYTDSYFWRPASTTDPANSTTSFYYPSSPSFNTLESKLLFNGGTSIVDMLTTLDSLGRPHVRQVKQGPSATNYDSTETDYSTVSRPSRFTVPYNGTAGQTNSTVPATTSTYDALGRPLLTTDGGGGTTSYTYTQNDVLVSLGPAPTGENAKQRQMEYDGLGRLTSVCEITNATGSGACGQTNAQTGYLTKYTYNALGKLTGVSQNAQSSNPQSRTYVYDLLGRMTSETNPESGTVIYSYDVVPSGCYSAGTSYPGDLTRRLDAAGNSICNYYDALHRLTDVGSPSGCKRFRYDNSNGVLGSKPSGVTVNYSLGRLAEAETDTCASPITTSSIVTDEWFSYTPRGEASDVYESTPHSGGYFHVSAQYWANGAIKQLASLVGLPTITYIPDGEGRPYQVSASSGQNPVTSANYNLYSTPPQLQVTLGSGDSDVFTLDPNTFRMSKYQFNVGSQTVTGTLSWNANGSLSSLNIADPFNSANTQTCNYTADDLARISKVDCGAAWGQTFAFDPFGNVQKTKISGSGGTSFAPTYQSSPSPTNRISLINGQAPTYDANGNSLNDTFHTYTWDAENRAVSIGTVNLTYDALGRMVEQSVGGTNSEVVYSPLSAKLALMNGATLTKAFVPLIGGAIAVYNSSGLAYYRHADHLGSSRFASTPTRTLYSDTAYSPFGEIYAGTGAIDPSFTGQNQDTTSGLYDFLYRENDPYQSRWSSPDPAGLAAVSLTDPQTLNRYAYVRNSPLELTDPLGLQPQCKVSCHQAGIPECISTCSSGGNSWYPDNNFGGGCTLDGTYFPCGWANGLASSGQAVYKCPNNDCTDIRALAGLGGKAIIQKWTPPQSWTTGDGTPDFTIHQTTGYWQTLGIVNQGDIQQQGKDIGTLFKGFFLFFHPLETTVVNAHMFLGAGVLWYGGAAAIAVGCGDVPVSILTCAVVWPVGVTTMGGGIVLGASGVQFFKDVTLPSYREWWNTFGGGHE